MRWIIRIGLVIAAVAVLGMTALFAIPTDEITSRVVARISEATGRNVVIRGDVRPRLVPVLGIRAEEIEIGNPDWVEEGPLLVAQSLDVGLAWAPLLRREIHVQSARMVAPRLTLVRAEDGRVSWDFGGEDAAPAGASDGGTTTAAPQQGSGISGPGRIAVDEVVIDEAAVLFIDRVAGRNLQYDPVDIRVTAPTAGGPIGVEATVGQDAGAVALTTTIGGLPALMSGDVSDLTIDLTWPGGSAGFDGRAGLSPAADGTVNFQASTIAPLFALAALPAPVLPRGFGQERMEFSGNLTFTEEGSLHLREAALALDETALRAELDLLPGAERPFLRGNVTVTALALPEVSDGDLDASGGDVGGQQASSGASAGAGWSQTPIDASALFSLDTDVSITAEALEWGDLAFGPLRARITNEDGRAVADIGSFSIFDGNLVGQIVLNARGTFSMRADLAMDEMALNPAVLALTGYDRLEGTGGGQISILAQGASVASLMRDLNGSGTLDFGPGAIIGLDIAGMLQNLDLGFRGAGARTVYDSISASFSVVDGVLSNDDLAMAAPWGGVRGRGVVDIGAQTLDYLVLPGLSARQDGTTRLTVPIRISGPWSDPNYAPDLEVLAQEELSEGIDALEDAASDAARDLVRDQLGISIDDDASTDDAIDQLEDELTDRLQEGLRGLFD
ncbi:MAG: AsmA family protein [Pseudomonadota bacterium]